MISCHPGAAFLDGKRSKIFTRLDIACKTTEGAGVMFTGKRGFIPARIAQVPIQPPPPAKPTAVELEIAARQREAQEVRRIAKEAERAKKAEQAAETAGEAVAVEEEAEEMETERPPPKAPPPVKYVWAAVAADGKSTKLDPKNDLIPVTALDGDYELGLANYCPYHAVNGLLLHKGTY